MKGNVIYWNPTSGYGFIECTELSGSVFFHKSKCKYEDIQLFDNVSFQTSEVTSGRHIGKTVAVKIKLNERGNFKNYDLRIGTIQDWNGRFGFIDYPTDGKKIFLFHTRLLYSIDLQNDDLVIFSPIVSTKDTTQLFAFFAYPIFVEKDISFLKSQYEKYQIPALKDYILGITNGKELTLEEKFELEIISNSENYLDLVTLLKKYNKDFSFTPDYDLLSKYVSNTHLIQLWESEIINSYNIDTIKEYFIRANADTKRLIVQKLSRKDNDEIIDFYFHHLRNQNKLERINNDLKTFLDIIYRNEKTRTNTLYEKTKQHLLSTLTPDELIDLWLHDYIDGLSEIFVVENFNIGDKNSIKLLLQKKGENGKPKYEELMSKIYEQYFIDIANGSKGFEDEYPNLVRYLKIFEDEFKNRYEEIINILQKTFKTYQQFVLWILGIKIEFDAYSFAQNNIDEINHYYRLKLILRYLNENEGIDLETEDSIKIDFDGLKDFAKNYKWNEIIYPTKIIEKEEIHSFLDDVVDYNSKCEKSFDIFDLAKTIYDSIEKYNEVHIRLWLYYLTDKEYYNYVGFRECFKKLSNSERKYFKTKANEGDFGEIVEGEISEVKPCIIFEQIEDTTKTYNAFVENIYFGNGKIKLRLENGEYTKELEQEYSSTGLNRIPSSHSLNKIPFKVTVESNKIIGISGLDELFIQIHTGEINKALGTVIDGNNPNRQNYTYVEDWKLRKEVIDYLNTNQDKKIETTIVNEPKNRYRRLDESSGIDLFEKTELFTIKIEDKNEYAIVWENIDFSEDRATYIFKCSQENHKIQIDKIADAIVSLAQLRSALSSAKDENELYIFKNSFGFITSIRKQRGKNLPFSNWLVKFENALKQQVPELPSDEELLELENWEPDIPHTARIKKSPRKNYKQSSIIREENLATTDIFEERQNKSEERVKEEDKIHNSNHLSLIREQKLTSTNTFTGEQNDKENLVKEDDSIKNCNLSLLLNTLKEINQFFTENLKIKI